VKDASCVYGSSSTMPRPSKPLGLRSRRCRRRTWRVAASDLGEGMKKAIVVLTIVAAGAMTFTAGAEAKHRKVLCAGQGMTPHHAYKPARCNVTATGPRGTGVAELRSMRWTRWGGYAKGRGLVTRAGQHTVRLRRPRPCGPPKRRVSVYSQMKIGRPSRPWVRILYCGD
jgi:hypothetical protein